MKYEKTIFGMVFSCNSYIYFLTKRYLFDTQLIPHSIGKFWRKSGISSYHGQVRKQFFKKLVK